MKNLLKLVTPTKKKRIAFFVLADILLSFLSFYLASFLVGLSLEMKELLKSGFLLSLSRIVIFSFLGVYKTPWRFVGLENFFNIVIGNFISEFLFFFVSLFLLRFSSGKILVADFFISTLAFSLIRVLKRFYNEMLRKSSNLPSVLIVGAGNTGERIVRELKRDKKFCPVTIVDDDVNKVGTLVHGVPVEGKISDIPKIVKRKKIDIAIIAIPSLSHKKISEIFNLLKSNGIKNVKIVPSLSKLPSSVVSVKDIRDISIEDLLFREEVKVDLRKLREFLSEKKILVTGAAGSIGSEIVRQLVKFDPAEIVAFEIDETELHNLQLELKDSLKNKKIKFVPVVGDVRDEKKVNEVFSRFKPNIVFHAAAYKHVPLMEFFPEESVKTNVFGTYNVAIASINNGVDKFVNISTDKAVNPTSVMGATKRLAEIICRVLNDLGKTKFISVRFGNVLGSRGSVVPIFLEQIKKGGPVTVTHPEMKRYFMTIPEAVLLVFQAAAMGEGGEVFVLDMGEPVKIVKLAEELIKLQGLEPYKDIDIVFTGLRPGEKLFEELLTAEEGTDRTYHEKIYKARIKKSLSLNELKNLLDVLRRVIDEGSADDIKAVLRKYIPFYKETS